MKAKNKASQPYADPNRRSEIIAKIADTTFANYGVTSISQHMPTKQVISDKICQLWSDPQKRNAMNAKRTRTTQTRYGVDNASQSPLIQAKIRATNTQRHGTAYPLQSEAVRAKARSNSLAKHGVEHHFMLPEFLKKRRATTLERYGVSNISQHAETHQRKVAEAKKRSKKFTFPSGIQVWVQGYESLAISQLLEGGLDEADIFVHHSLPTIWYCFDGRNCRYYPDIFIASLNKIIEVKSVYTYYLDERKNLAKEAACLTLGYQFEFMIYDIKQKLIECNTLRLHKEERCEDCCE